MSDMPQWLQIILDAKRFLGTYNAHLAVVLEIIIIFKLIYYPRNIIKIKRHDASVLSVVLGN